MFREYAWNSRCQSRLERSRTGGKVYVNKPPILIMRSLFITRTEVIHVYLCCTASCRVCFYPLAVHDLGEGHKLEIRAARHYLASCIVLNAYHQDTNLRYRRWARRLVENSVSFAAIRYLKGLTLRINKGL